MGNAIIRKDHHVARGPSSSLGGYTFCFSERRADGSGGCSGHLFYVYFLRIPPFYFLFPLGGELLDTQQRQVEPRVSGTPSSIRRCRYRRFELPGIWTLGRGTTVFMAGLGFSFAVPLARPSLIHLDKGTCMGTLPWAEGVGAK